MKTVAAFFNAFFGRNNQERQAVNGKVRISDAQYRRAIAELSRCSDAELRDIGINRGQIREVVYHGREVDRLREAA